MNFEIGRSEDFLVEHCYSCAVPGYLIVSPLAAVESLEALPRQSADNPDPQRPLGVGLNLPKHGRNYPYKAMHRTLKTLLRAIFASGDGRR